MEQRSGTSLRMMVNWAATKLVFTVSVIIDPRHYHQPSHDFEGLTSVVFVTRLSALLAEAEPSNTRYVQAASLSLEFALKQASRHGYGTSGSFVTNTSGLCDGEISMADTATASGLGCLMEAMSVMYSVARNNDTGIRLQEVVASALDKLGTNLDSNGVLSNQNLNSIRVYGDMYFLRGLAEAYRRGEGTLSVDLRSNMKTVLGVHYNAIRDRSTTGDNVYSRNWRGPPTSTTFDLYNQAAAAQILVDGIDLFSSDTTSSPSPSARASPKLPALVIAGATVGSIICMSLTILVIFCAVRQWRRKNRIAASSEAGTSARTIDPFVAAVSEKRTAFSHKYPLPESLAQVLAPEAQLMPLRPHSSEPSGLQEATDSLGGRHNIVNAVDTRVDSSDNRGGVYFGGDTEISPTLPDMIRVLYERLWHQDGSGSPPEYRSNAGESPQRA
ncbi:hypothetical protein PM082_014477 [Marasmius tenuissimus]|nr:hypothetical protein PM082_014477 [Marasmius tenuissimus]